MSDVADRIVATPPSGVTDEAVLDFEHLSVMTLGERALEIQVLELFDRQAELLLARMQDAAPPGVASLAHTLGGSARAVGAWRVAAAAEALERAATGAEATPSAPVPSLARLTAAVEEARLAIGEVLRFRHPVAATALSKSH